MTTSKRYISTSHLSQTNPSDQRDFFDHQTRGNDILNGSATITIFACRAEAPLTSSWSVSSLSSSSNNTVELQIADREKIGQGTFGYR